MFALLTLRYIVKVAVYTWIFDISLEGPSAELSKANFPHLVNDLEFNLQFFLRTVYIPRRVLYRSALPLPLSDYLSFVILTHRPVIYGYFMVGSVEKEPNSETGGIYQW